MKKIIKTFMIFMGSLMLVVSCANPTDTVIDDEPTIVDANDETTDTTDKTDVDDEPTIEGDNPTEEEPIVVETVYTSLILIEDFNESSIWKYDYKFILDGETIVEDNIANDVDKLHTSNAYVFDFTFPNKLHGQLKIDKGNNVLKASLGTVKNFRFLDKTIIDNENNTITIFITNNF